jgi:simple sugar transport system permease protein
LVIVIANVVALAIGLAVTAVIVWWQGKPVGEALQALWDGSFGSAFAVGNTLNKAAALLLVALGFIVARKAGLVSIGGEGQIYIGGLFAVATGLWLAGRVSGPVAVTVAVLAGALGGALWGAIAGVLKARFDVNEVIATLLLNFVAINVVGLMVQEPNLLREPVTSTASLPQSRQLPFAVRLPRLSFPDGTSRAHFGVVLALVAVVAVAFLLKRTTLGFRIRMTGLNASMAVRTGVPVAVLTVGVMAMSGALCGVAGTSVLLGEQFRLQQGFSPGYGFDGVAVALLARDSPFGAILAALLFGALRAGGGLLEARVQVPQALVLVVQGAIILAVAGTAHWVRRRPTARTEPAQPVAELEPVPA